MPFIEYETKRVLFVHVPKTGGTSIETWMRSIAPLCFHAVGTPNCSKVTPQHHTHNDLAQYFPRGWFDYKFTVVRNPYSRIESEYKMRYILGVNSLIPAFPPFGNWLERTLNQAKANPWVLDNHMRPQVQFLGEGIELFRLEEGLESILQRVAAASGLPPPQQIATDMVSSQFTGEIRWSDYEIDLVQETYARDFARFGYSLDIGQRAPM